MSGPLEGLRVLDVGEGIAAPFAAKLLGDLGAEVVKVERPGGDPLRGSPLYAQVVDGISAGFAYVNTSKQSVVLDLDSAAGRAELLAALSAYDAVVASGTQPELAVRGLGYEEMASVNERLVLTTVSGFGSIGPYAGYQMTHLVACAMGGWAHNCGLPDREPLQAGGAISELFAGSYAAVATLAAVRAAARSGRGAHVDVSIWEAMVSAALVPTLVWEYGGVLWSRHSDRNTGPSFIMPCADGYLGVNVLTFAQWEALCAMVGKPDLAHDPRYAQPVERLQHAGEVYEALSGWFADTRVEDALLEGQAWRLPFAPVPAIADVLSLPPHRERRFFQPLLPGATAVVPGLPFRMSRTPSLPGPPPRLGEHNPVSLRRPAAARPDPAPGASLPLEGVRIIDLSMFMSGPVATMIAADLGADVIKVESVQRLDGWRGMPMVPGSARPWETAPSFNWVNRNKRGITLNLADERGADLLRRLVRQADVLVENYTPRVMENFGLTYEVLRAERQDLVMLSMPGYGDHNAWRDFTAFAWSTEQVSGICSVTGYPGGPPMFTGTTGGDPLAGVMGALALMAALDHRGRTGEGQHIDLSQAQASAMFTGDLLVHVSAGGAEPGRQGNLHPAMAPHGIYRCAGEDRWVAIACRDARDWAVLAEETGAGPEFSHCEDRLKRREDVDELVARWTAGRSAEEVMHRLQARGVPAGVVMNGRDLFENEHLRARGFLVRQERAEVGVRHYPTLPFTFRGLPLSFDRPAPTLGQHNREVLGGLLGLSDEELQELEEAEVIGTTPLAARV
jgi:crotonobetainyl-CoA:carnitine CoA-transferase CaiB-like acyl-CoA transferase